MIVVRAINTEREKLERSKDEAKKIKSDNFTKRNIGKIDTLVHNH